MALLALERVARNAAFGVRFWDVATGSVVIDGLHVEVFPRARRHVRTKALPGPSGVYVAHDLPGLRDFAFRDVAQPQDLWPAATRGFRVEVSDPEGRYLPMAFDADLPHRGLFDGLAPWLSPPSSPPQLLPDRVALFSAPTRPPPEPLATVHAQLVDATSGRELAWGLLAVRIDGVVRGTGLADARGRVVVFFPYPEPPRIPPVPLSPPFDSFSWSVEFTAFGGAGSPASPPEPFADLAQVVDSLAVPRAIVGSPSSPLRLSYRQPLVAPSSLLVS